MDLKRGIDLAVTNVIEELKKLSRPIEGKKEIALDLTRLFSARRIL